MSRNAYFNWVEYYRLQKLLEKRKKLYGVFAEWDGKPRLAEGCCLPWPPYTRHNWFELFTHFLYYPFHNFKEFAEVYGLNYKSSQTWANLRLIPESRWGLNGDWKGNKCRWLMEVLENNDREVLKMLREPDKYVLRYRPLPVPRK